MSVKIKAIVLAAGLGTRLKPLTNIWPKCLMPINSRPLLEYWLSILFRANIKEVLVNTHYLSQYVEDFLSQDQFKKWTKSTYEGKLLGTAGTVRRNLNFIGNSKLLLIHADNWSCCNFDNFFEYHIKNRPSGTLITMMVFRAKSPSSCGIVELDSKGVVVQFHEKVKNPPGNLANAAVYILEPEVVSWIKENETVSDFSTGVLPNFLGRIATWENTHIHKDIGTIETLASAQKDSCDAPIWTENSEWQKRFNGNEIQRIVNEL